MVDFAEMNKQLKAWKIRKQEVGCNCMAVRPKTCYEFQQDIWDEGRNKKCECKCHE